MALNYNSPARTATATMQQFSMRAGPNAAQFVGSQFENKLRYRVHSQLHEDSGRRGSHRAAGGPSASLVDPSPVPLSVIPASSFAPLERFHSRSSRVLPFSLIGRQLRQ